MGIALCWGLRIPLRDGCHLSGTLYLPRDRPLPAPCVFALTPYVADGVHQWAKYFAQHGLPFVVVDVRGRGNSEGQFRPLIQEAQDGFDVVEWLARQPYCNSKVAMYGGSYLGYAQWATAKEFPPHLETIVPSMAPYAGLDFPLRCNVFTPFLVRWLTHTAGKTRQMRISQDDAFWATIYREAQESGRPLRELDALAGLDLPVFREWLQYPQQGPYWDAHNPTLRHYEQWQIPVLTVTGAYDGNQPGALEHYKQHMRHASADARAQHYLVIGPWDHAGCVEPCAEFQGLKVGSASVIDMLELHVQWYAWTMRGGPKPAFLQGRVAYYVLGCERWRYAETLDAVTLRFEPLYLRSNENPTDVFRSGSLTPEPPEPASVISPDHYIYDPRDTRLALFESTLGETSSLTDQRWIHASRGTQLIYHSVPFEHDMEISGFFKLTVWLAIDQPDTDFRVCIYEIDLNGGSLELTGDWLRARYRESFREAHLIRTHDPLRFEFEHFQFVARVIRKGHRLRLVIGPLNSINEEKNYNSGGVVAGESMEDARTVTVKLYHDDARPSALYVPIGRHAM